MTTTARDVAGATGRARPAPMAAVDPPTGRLGPLGLDAVRITGGLWARRQAANREHTLDHVLGWLESQGWLRNFDLAATGGDLVEGRRGREFSDSEVFKWLEAVAWELGRHDDPRLAGLLDGVVARVAAAQRHDGYVGTMFGHAGQRPRWSDLEWGHELYCIGHLAQAAVARRRTGHVDDVLVDVAVRACHLVCDVFGPGARDGVCGHPEIELGLLELGRALDEPRFVERAGWFVRRRGHGLLADVEFGRSYYQDDVPVLEADALRGHAVRANYLAAAAVDVAVQDDDDALHDAVAGQHRRTVERRTYVTGGQGSHHQDEAFGGDWVLPPDRAYSETCAAIGSIMLAWRLLLSTGGAEHADLVERTLYNVVATSPADDGRAFFYANTLHQRTAGTEPSPDSPSRRASSALRAPWFDVSCCPTNLARTFAGLGGLMATRTPGGVQVHQYAPMHLEVAVGDANADEDVVRLEVLTAYPDDGRVEVRVEQGAGRPWTLALRVPGWCERAELTEPGQAPRPVGPGTVEVAGPATGRSVVLDLDLTPRLLRPDRRVDAVRGCVAVQRGPEVWALESTDLERVGLAADVADVVLDPAVPPALVDEVVVVGLLRADGPGDPGPAPGTRDLTPADPPPAHAAQVPLVRYRDWARRGPSTMRVWIPVRP